MKLGMNCHFWIGNDSHIRPQKWPNKITDLENAEETDHTSSNWVLIALTCNIKRG